MQLLNLSLHILKKRNCIEKPIIQKQNFEIVLMNIFGSLTVNDHTNLYSIKRQIALKNCIFSSIKRKKKMYKFLDAGFRSQSYSFLLTQIGCFCTFTFCNLKYTKKEKNLDSSRLLKTKKGRYLEQLHFFCSRYRPSFNFRDENFS